MAFTVTSKEETVFGNKRIVTGVYTNTSSSTGGELTTGLNEIIHVTLQPKGSAVIATASVVNETLPLTGSDVTIVTSADEVGTFLIIGS